MPWPDVAENVAFAFCAVIAWRGWPSIRNCRHCKLTEEQCETKIEDLTSQLEEAQSDLENANDALEEITEQHEQLEQLEVENEALRSQIIQLTAQLEAKDFVHV